MRYVLDLSVHAFPAWEKDLRSKCYKGWLVGARKAVPINKKLIDDTLHTTHFPQASRPPFKFKDPWITSRNSDERV
ncbi:hypothetical protein KaCgl_06300 [Corynebacterium glutamicum]|nr:hypothetical protein KaCgl_06300 [Corynebacterium glutamicum]